MSFENPGKAIVILAEGTSDGVLANRKNCKIMRLQRCAADFSGEKPSIFLDADLAESKYILS